MNKKEEVVKEHLNIAHKNLDDLRQKVRWNAEHEIEYDCFKKNMISLLVRMTELKKEIDTLQYMLFIIEVHDS